MTDGFPRPEATTVEVADLVRSAWAGEIRVPRFQRAFRWGQKDVVRLFDSIVHGYPIGSLLFWEREAIEETLQMGGLTIKASPKNVARYVVDGQQRITSLASALHPEGGAVAPYYLAYDARKESFIGNAATDRPWQIPLPVLFDSPRLLAWFRDSDIDDYFDRASVISTAIRQYKVPIYVVRTDDEGVLREIFDRLNNYGKQLSRAEVFSALHADVEIGKDEQFSFPRIAERISASLRFGQLADSTIMRSILARRGPDVERDIHLEFAEDRKGQVDFIDEDRLAAFRDGELALRRAVEFLQRDSHVPHVSLLPYAHLLVVLTRFFSFHTAVDSRNRQLLRRWFWRAALVGPRLFKGDTTGTTRALNSRIKPGQGTSDAVQALLATVAEPPASKPDLSTFATHHAATKIVLGSWWHARPRSLTSGQRYEQADLAATLQDRTTAADAVPAILSTKSVSPTRAKWAANRILLPDPEIDPSEIATTLLNPPPAIDQGSRLEIAVSHAISTESLSCLARGDLAGFLNARNATLKERLNDFLLAMCEWRMEDTPPLDEFIVEDSDEPKSLFDFDDEQTNVILDRPSEDGNVAK